MAFRNQHCTRSRSRSPIDRRKNGRSNEFSNNLINFDRYSYKAQIPSSVLILKGLEQHILEVDIKNATLRAGCASKDVRLIKNEGEDQSRGLAIVEFYSVEDAQRLLMTQNGELMVKGQYRAVMQYFECADWYCKCGVRNFKKRESCLKCGNSDICTYPTNIVMLTCLPIDMTEAKLLEIVNTNCDLAIKCLRRTRDGNCYIETNNITDAILLYNTLGSVDLKVGFYRHKNIPNDITSSASSAVAAAHWNNTLADVPRLAEYSASLYAKSPEDKKKYLEYYTNYYTKQIGEGRAINVSQETPDGLGTQIYPAPDVTTFQYDQTSGYYYDASTKLYYDANTQYFYNSQTNTYLYWDATNLTYYNVNSHKDNDSSSGTRSAGEKSEEKKVDDKDKVKVAKRVAKDMEKWAKTLNHRKEVSKVAVNVDQESIATQSRSGGSADVCFNVIGNKDERPKKSLVAAYDSEEEPDETLSGEEKLQIDWNKLACLICKRQFNSKDILTKHIQKSDLHESNLRMWYTSRNLDPNDEAQRIVQYRDRAKERRLKFGEADIPPELKIKQKYQKIKEATVTYDEPTKKGIGSDNVGNKLLQKMGWTQGQGLGKSNQGRTSIIEAEARISSAGLGTQAIGMQPGPGETYKDCVKKMMRMRYQQMD